MNFYRCCQCLKIFTDSDSYRCIFVTDSLVHLPPCVQCIAIPIIGRIGEGGGMKTDFPFAVTRWGRLKTGLSENVSSEVGADTDCFQGQVLFLVTVNWQRCMSQSIMRLHTGVTFSFAPPPRVVETNFFDFRCPPY